MRKRLYSFRADEELLNTLRDKADECGITVTELMHQILYQGLQSLHEKQATTKIDDFYNLDKIKVYIEERMEKMKYQIKDEILAEIMSEIKV